ncbi:hypothetical protein RchiOBHm_Chr1g0378541 [Rosa chinensis]|uniref:Uncharacterized protein n=1 Tax=Rosa chinensis TaxID=74649 RepID=A0A2P6SNB6_ROSCH|nr:hypothetical protein RchiOBHm_Chr1g0378541 [Rosa chinensis]
MLGRTTRTRMRLWSWMTMARKMRLKVSIVELVIIHQFYDMFVYLCWLIALDLL